MDKPKAIEFKDKAGKLNFLEKVQDNFTSEYKGFEEKDAGINTRVLIAKE